MLTKFLRCITVFCFAMCLVIMITGKSAIHEIEALAYGLIAVVSMIGEALISRLDAVIVHDAAHENPEIQSNSVIVVKDNAMYRFETAQEYKAVLEKILENIKNSTSDNQVKSLYNQSVAILDWMKEDFPSHYSEHGVSLRKRISQAAQQAI